MPSFDNGERFLDSELGERFRPISNQAGEYAQPAQEGWEFFELTRSAAQALGHTATYHVQPVPQNSHNREMGA